MHAVNGCTEPLRALVLAGLSASAVSARFVIASHPEPQTALHAACRFGRLACAQALLLAGADPHAPDAEGKLPIDRIDTSYRTRQWGAIPRSADDAMELRALMRAAMAAPPQAPEAAAAERGRLLRIAAARWEEERSAAAAAAAAAQTAAAAATEKQQQAEAARRREEQHARLLSAVAYGEPSALASLLVESGGADVNSAGSDGWTSLHEAASRCNITALRLLLTAGAATTAAARQIGTPLDAVGIHGRLTRPSWPPPQQQPSSSSGGAAPDEAAAEEARAALRQGAETECARAEVWASMTPDERAALLKVAASTSSPQPKGKEDARAPAAAAVAPPAMTKEQVSEVINDTEDILAVCDVLERAPALVRACLKEQPSALDFAVSCGRIELTELLLRFGAPLEGDGPEWEMSTIGDEFHEEVTEAERERLQRLLREAGPAEERARLFDAAAGRLLAEARESTRRRWLREDLLSALTSEQTPNLELLTEALAGGADASCWGRGEEESGWTPLHEAASRCCVASVRLLLAAGAAPDARDAEVGTPLDVLRGMVHFCDPDAAALARVVQAQLESAGSGCAQQQAAWRDLSPDARRASLQAILSDWSAKAEEAQKLQAQHARAQEARRAAARAASGARERLLSSVEEITHFGRAGARSALALARRGGASLRQVLSNSQTPLHVAAYNNAIPSVAFLLSAGAATDALDECGLAPGAAFDQNVPHRDRARVRKMILDAAATPAAERLRRFEERGEEAFLPDAIDEEGARKNLLEDLLETLSESEQSEASRRLGNLLAERAPAVRQLCEESGWTPLHEAAWRSNRAAVVYLLAAGADPRAKAVFERDGAGWTPEEVAGSEAARRADRAGAEALRTLLRNRRWAAEEAAAAEGGGGASSSSPAAAPSAALQAWEAAGTPEARRLLLDAAAVRDRDSQLLLDALHGRPAARDPTAPWKPGAFQPVVLVMRKLLAICAHAPVAVNAPTGEKGETALHTAASLGIVPAVAALLLAGGDAAARTRDGRTPAEVAGGEWRDEIAALLRAAEQPDSVASRTAAWAGGAAQEQLRAALRDAEADVADAADHLARAAEKGDRAALEAALRVDAPHVENSDHGSADVEMAEAGVRCMPSCR